MNNNVDVPFSKYGSVYAYNVCFIHPQAYYRYYANTMIDYNDNNNNNNNICLKSNIQTSSDNYIYNALLYNM